MTELIIGGHDHGWQRSTILTITALLSVIIHLAIFFSAYPSHTNVTNAEPGHRAVVVTLVALAASESHVYSGETESAVAKNKDKFTLASSEKIEEASPALPHVRKIIAQVTPEKDRSGEKKQKKTGHANRKQSANSGQTKQAWTMPQSGQAGGMQKPALSGTDPLPLDHTRNLKPSYPEIARLRGQEGKVILLARVDSTGHLTGLDVSKSSGYPMLDEAAIKAVRQWRFKPATRAGVAVNGTVAIPVDFRLR